MSIAYGKSRKVGAARLLNYAHIAGACNLLSLLTGCTVEEQTTRVGSCHVSEIFQQTIIGRWLSSSCFGNFESLYLLDIVIAEMDEPMPRLFLSA